MPPNPKLTLTGCPSLRRPPLPTCLSSVGDFLLAATAAAMPVVAAVLRAGVSGTPLPFMPFKRPFSSRGAASYSGGGVSGVTGVNGVSGVLMSLRDSGVIDCLGVAGLGAAFVGVAYFPGVPFFFGA